MGAEQSRHGARGKSGTAPKDDAAQQEDLYESLSHLLLLTARRGHN